MTEIKSKAPLSLMEQVVMILVFAFAAALCVQAFVQADALSMKSYARDKAAAISQTMAETVKANKGDLDEVVRVLKAQPLENGFVLYYDKEWEIVEEAMAEYKAEFFIMEKTSYLGKGEITVKEINTAESIFTLPVNWQEVAADE